MKDRKTELKDLMLNEADSPCQYSVEELRARAKRAIRDVEEGRVISHEDLKNGISGGQLIKEVTARIMQFKDKR